ncbi:MAG: bifunctional riboflavin kinase/FAD synthetase [Gammaproteobacteria bacterium]|nr:bifunctional riboflavin kinase/FAD synthetase [Gammaproteobacteria bacterium]
MELVRGLVNITEQHKNCVLTIGNFDGVHIGHQSVLNKLKQVARELGVPSAVMIFEPQPQEVFLKENAAARVLTFRDKFEKLSQFGIDRLICVRFNPEFAAMSAEDFIEDLLVNRLGVKHLIVGDDFRFGSKRRGDFTLLSEGAKKFGFSVQDSQTLKYSNERASSTEVRRYLSESRFECAKDLLSEPFKFHGKVIHGEKNGRKFGFPTANIAVKRNVLPIKGVFAVKATIKGQELFGVANIGNKPTLNGVKPVLEVHLFNFAQDIYGQRLSIEPLFKIRDEQKFSSVEQLIQQIEADVKSAKAALFQ